MSLAVMVIHSQSSAFGLNKKASCGGLLRGDLKYFNLKYLLYISMIMQSAIAKFHIDCLYMIIFWSVKYLR